MLTRTESFWNRPFGQRVFRAFIVVLLTSVILYEGWLGRNRLFVAQDRHYQISFVLFVTGISVLLDLLRRIGEKTRRGGPTYNFRAAQVQAGIVGFSAICLFSCFSRYTSSKLDLQSGIDCAGTAAIIAVLNAVFMKRPSEGNMS